MKEIDLGNKASSKIFALVYGASGTGKTHLMGTVGELGSVLIIDIDQGVKTIQNAKDIRESKYFSNLYAVSFDKFKDLDQAYKLALANDVHKWNTFLQLTGDRALQRPFDWIIWDTWSELQWSMIEELRSKDSAMSGNGELKFRSNIQIQHWGMMTDLNKLAITSLKSCPVNQIFTMQEKMTKDEVSGQIFGGPAIHGKLVEELPPYFDVVVHTYTDLSGAYWATTKSKGRWPGKTRLGAPGDYKSPTAKQLFQ